MMSEIAGQLSRRKLLRRAIAAAAPWPAVTMANRRADTPEARSAEFSKVVLAPEDDAFLEELEKANFLFFWEQADAETGLVKDRAHARAKDESIVASIAATGFGLTALCIGTERGYITAAEAHQRVMAALHFLWDKISTHRGFFYHFANVKTGERIWDSEVSSIDTAILLCGVLTCREYFRKPEITRFASDIFNRVEWSWLSEDTPLLPHGWSPETGFLPYRWDYYSELMMMYLLGLGSERHPLPAQTWHAWKRVTFDYEGIRYIGSYAPLFVHQYSQAWFDFRGKRDQYIDYFRNSILATEVHKRFCLELGRKFPSYTEDLWGITASDSQYGYVAWGGPPQLGPIDGTVAPSAAGGSLPFLPDATLRVLKHIRKQYEAGAWSRYGFVNAFNPLKNWYDTDVVAIDTGITMLMAENLRTGLVWKTFMRSREAQRGFDRAGFYSF